MELNKVYHQDCEDGMRHIPNKSINAIVTDPPYLYLNHKLDRPFDEDAVFAEWDRILKDDGFIVMFGRGESFYRWNTKLIGLGFEFKEEIIWQKNRVSNVFGKVGRNHETISILSKKGTLREVKIPYAELRRKQIDGIERTVVDLKRLISGVKNPESFESVIKFLNEGISEATVANVQGISSNSKKIPNRSVSLAKNFSDGFRERSIIQENMDNRKSHPTQKPVRLMERLINLTTDEDAIVLDPFIGSGSTAIACINTNRQYIGFELDKEYYDIATKRIEEHQQSLF